jgi:hypothetical protein
MKQNSPYTLAHEVGHYLDHKWGYECGLGNLLSDASVNLSIVADSTSPERAQWAKTFQNWVMNISERANISSEYMQRRREAFARFVDSFITWTSSQAGGYESRDSSSSWGDRFHQGDYMQFIKLLQQKAYIDAKDGNPLGSRKNPFTK